MSTTVQTRSRRQAGLTALYLGLFATVWFSVPSADGVLRALAGLITGLTTGVAADLVAATGTGLALLGYAVTTLAGLQRRG